MPLCYETKEPCWQNFRTSTKSQTFFKIRTNYINPSASNEASDHTDSLMSLFLSSSVWNQLIISSLSLIWGKLEKKTPYGTKPLFSTTFISPPHWQLLLFSQRFCSAFPLLFRKNKKKAMFLAKSSFLITFIFGLILVLCTRKISRSVHRENFLALNEIFQILQFPSRRPLTSSFLNNRVAFLKFLDFIVYFHSHISVTLTMNSYLNLVKFPSRKGSTSTLRHHFWPFFLRFR